MHKNYFLKLAGHRYKIKYKILDKDYGLTMSEDQEIHLCRDLKADRELETLFHEIMHVFEHEMDIKISHNNINRLGVVLASAFIDNPSLHTHINTLIRQIRNERRHV